MTLAAFFVGLLAVGGDAEAPDGGGVPVDRKKRAKLQIPTSGELESTFRRQLSYSGVVGLYGSYDAIAGYTPATDVTAQAAIDLDVTAIINALDGTDAGYARRSICTRTAATRPRAQDPARSRASRGLSRARPSGRRAQPTGARTRTPTRS